jgi:hypothetical protein
MLTAEQNVIRNVALWLALALAQPALAQTAPTAAPNPSPIKPSPAKTSSTKPSPAKPAAKKPEPPKPDTAEHGPCIGVIPHIGESFAVQSIGLTMFGNDLKEVPIESWGLDDLIVARVRAAAGASVAVRRIAYPANAFATFDNPPLFHNTENDIKEVVQSVAPASRCERYVVVIRSGSQWSNTNESVKGIGIVHAGIIDRLSVTFLFTMTALDIVDGHTFEIRKKGAGSIEDNQLLHDLLTMPSLRGPNRKLEDFPWPPPPDAVMGLREPTRALLAASLDKVLPKLLAP